MEPFVNFENSILDHYFPKMPTQEIDLNKMKNNLDSLICSTL